MRSFPRRASVITLPLVALLSACSGGPEPGSAVADEENLAGAAPTNLAALPTIAAVTPSSGPEGMSPYPVIKGTNFQAGAKVYVNGTPARGAWPGGTIYLVFQPPLTSVLGPADVKVVNPDGGTATLRGGFTYTSASPPGGTGNGDDYPRLGMASIGGPQQYAS